MPVRYRCDKCGKDLGTGIAGRFVVRIEVFAAEGPIEITRDDLEKDHAAEMNRVIDQLSRTPLDQIEDQTYRAFRFDLCADCHRAYLQGPLGGSKL